MSSRVSTFAPGPVVLAALFAAIFLSSRNRFHPQPAMQEGCRGRATSRAADRLAVRAPLMMVAASSTSTRLRQLAHEALGMRPPQQPQFGRALRVSPLRRIRSAVLLLVLLGALGIATAATIGLVAFLAGFFLEQAIK